MGRLRVSEDVLHCMLVSLVYGIVLGVTEGRVVYLGGLKVFGDLFKIESTPYFGPTLKGKIIFTWLFLDINISCICI